MRTMPTGRLAAAAALALLLSPLALAAQEPASSQAEAQEELTGLRAEAVKMGTANLVAPVLVSRELPKYPEGTEIEGDVYIEAVVDKLGAVREPKLVRGLANEEMNKRALEAITKWTFKAGTVDDEPVHVIALFTVTYRKH